MARSFFITRASANSEDPTALVFFPPKGSDELHEALKEAFPFEANLAARMRAAVIEFLLQEQQADQLTPVSTEYLPSPQSTFLSTMPSPAIGTSFTSQDASPSRRQSAAAGQPTQEALMDVWSLPNKPQAKIHTRRTMTVDEKKAYKQKRIIGACADCKRRRRKCEHTNTSGGSSIAPQKVGKHKKRASAAAPVCKPAAPVDFSLNLDDAFGPMAMDAEMLPSFDFGPTTDFDFSPDLSDDWQLFPDLPMVNTNFVDPWAPDYNHYDASLYSPRAGLSQSRVSTGPGAASSLDQSMLNRPTISSGDCYGGMFGTDIYGTNTIGHQPISPVTPVSLSPMSRTQSGSGRDAQYQTSASSGLTFSTGDHIDQQGVSRDKPMQVPLNAAPDLPSPSDAYATATFAGSQNSSSAIARAKLRMDSDPRPSRSRHTMSSSDTQRFDRSGGTPNREDLSCPFAPAETCSPTQSPTTTSRLRSRHQGEFGLLNAVQLHLEKPQKQSSSHTCQPTYYQVCSPNRSTALKDSQQCGTNASVAQAPLCVALYAAYCTASQFSSALAVIAMLVLGATILGLQLGDRKTVMTMSSLIVQSLRTVALIPPLHLLGSQPKQDRITCRRSSDTSSGRMKSMSSHLGLPGASVMV